MDFITERIKALFNADDEVSRRYALIAVEAAEYRCRMQLKRVEEVCSEIGLECHEKAGAVPPAGLLDEWESAKEQAMREALDAYTEYMKTSALFLAGREGAEFKELRPTGLANHASPPMRRRESDRRNRTTRRASSRRQPG